MIERTQFGDVTAFWLSWPRSRFAGYGVHIFQVRNVLVDTGFPGLEGAVAGLLSDLRPEGAVITHHHEDHAGNVELLAAAGIPLAMDDRTLELVQNPGPIGFYRHLTWKAMRPLRSKFSPFDDPSLQLIHTPGHCTNHHSVWDTTTGTLFAGDLFLGVKVRVAHSYENPREHVQSLRAMAARAPDRVLCAHRGFIKNGTRALLAKADWMEELIYRAEQRMTQGISDRDIRRELLGAHGTTFYISAGDYSANNLIHAIRQTRVTSLPATHPADS